MPTIVYIAGFRQHAGKTFTSIGLISRLREIYSPEEIGYIKPVGQELFTLPNGKMIDKDAVIIKEFILPTLNMDIVSPVRLGKGVTKNFLISEEKEEIITGYCNSIDEAISQLSDKKIIIAEGTGHPGVGGIVNLSNSDVSIRLNADIIYLAGGGIGKTLDMLEVDINYFHSKGARIKGIIFNKLIPDKIEEMKKYITEDYLTQRFSKDGKPIHILGWMPEIKGLNKPSMRLISKGFPKGRPIGNTTKDCWGIPVTGVSIVSQSHRYFIPEKDLNPGDVVIISAKSIRRLKKIVEFNKKRGESERITGIIFTCTEMNKILNKSMDLVLESGIPAIYVPEDSSTADEILYKCIKNTKLQSYDNSKNDLIISAFKKHFNLEKFKEDFM
ncbi:MAG: AAA family ATPase [Spirochaetales bacterium]|nr:AAA family ATPase [Spirochaetales bacterium]